MKNKEIEELLNELKNTADTSFFAVCGSEEELDKMPKSVCKFLSLNDKQAKLLLSYIEQLEKRNKELYEGFMATQEELTDYATKNEQLEKLCNKYEQEHKTTFEIWKRDIKKLEQLENNRDKAFEYIEKHTDKIKKIVIPKIDFNYKKLLDILKGDSDE